MLIILVGNSGKNRSLENIYEEVSPQQPKQNMPQVVQENNELDNMTGNAAYSIHHSMNMSHCEAYGVHEARQNKCRNS